MSDAVTDSPEPIYTIGGVQYRLEPLSWRQNKWLADHLFKTIDVSQLDYAVIHDLLREQGDLFMAICLIAEGQTRADHSRLPFTAIRERADVFAGLLTGGEVAQFGPHFFRSCRPDQLAMLVPGAKLRSLFAEAEQPSPAPGASGSSAASSRSVEETLHELLTSSPSGDPLIQIPTSGGALSAMPSTAPSLAGSASNSPG